MSRTLRIAYFPMNSRRGGGDLKSTLQGRSAPDPPLRFLKIELHILVRADLVGFCVGVQSLKGRARVLVLPLLAPFAGNLCSGAWGRARRDPGPGMLRGGARLSSPLRPRRRPLAVGSRAPSWRGRGAPACGGGLPPPAGSSCRPSAVRHVDQKKYEEVV